MYASDDSAAFIFRVNYGATRSSAMSVTIHQTVGINIAVSSTEHFKECYRTCKLSPVILQLAAHFHYARFHREYKQLIEFEMLPNFEMLKRIVVFRPEDEITVNSTLRI
jgi:hypothetical protein